MIFRSFNSVVLSPTMNNLPFTLSLFKCQWVYFPFLYFFPQIFLGYVDTILGFSLVFNSFFMFKHINVYFIASIWKVYEALRYNFDACWSADSCLILDYYSVCLNFQLKAHVWSHFICGNLRWPTLRGYPSRKILYLLLTTTTRCY